MKRNGEAAPAGEVTVAAGAATQRCAIVVAGMHRSGTSATARVLSLMGCALPDTLMEPNANNERGYWESRAIMELNDEILESAGSRWDDWERFNPDWHRSPLAGQFRDRARAVLAAEFGEAPLFVLKDPRICRLLPFWTPVLEEFGAAPRFVLPIRNPLDVAASLEARNGFDPSYGQLLWLRHVLDAEADTRGQPRAVLRYEALLRMWQPAVRRVGEELGLAWPLRPGAVEPEVAAFLDDGMRHHARDDAEVLDNDTLPRWVRDAFAVFDRRARGESRQGDDAILDGIRQALDEAGPALARPLAAGRDAFRQVHKLERQLEKRNEEAAEGKSEAKAERVRADELAQALSERKARIGALEQSLADRQRELDETLAGRDALLAETRQQLEAEQARTARLVSEAEERNRHLSDLEDRLEERDRRLEESDSRIEALESELADAWRHAEAETGRAGDLADRIERQDRRIAELEETLKRRERQLKAELAKKSRMASGYFQKAETYERLFTKLKKSTSWRLMAPVRELGRGWRRFGRKVRGVRRPYGSGAGSPDRDERAVGELVSEKVAPIEVEFSEAAAAPTEARRPVTKEDRKALIARAQNATNAKDWAQAVQLWGEVDKRFGDDEKLSSLARFNLSIARRVPRIEDCKQQIEVYKASRAKAEPKIAVYTSIVGGYDTIKLPERLDGRLDYILFTDNPAPDTGVFRIRPIEYHSFDPTRSARFVKTHPHMLLGDYDMAVWIDANILILDDIYPLIESFLSSGKPVGAIPHPLRQSLEEEVEACIGLTKDDPDPMRDQLAKYREEDSLPDELIESNLMMFDLRNARIADFLDAWWTEIDRHSRRDQLSLTYALERTGTDWHRLTERPDSVRNHPAFALVPHDAADSATALIDALEPPTFDPYSGPSYAEQRKQRIAAQRDRHIDIVVCVHNALDDVKQCLESVARARGSDRQKLIVIDDGSDEPTATYLREFAGNAPWVELHRSDNPRGYTKAANHGLEVSSGELAILLNSDTIVTDGWAEKMADAVFSTPGAGIVGPMSNAASYQSLPDIEGKDGQTAINELPAGVTAEDMNLRCEEWTVAGVLPRVLLVHGFCFGVTREAIQKIGLFDEESFPRGFGEENDYCFRAADAGIDLVVATHTYVFHEKSKSYGEGRAPLAAAGSKTLRNIHGHRRVKNAIADLEDNFALCRMRQKIKTYPLHALVRSNELYDPKRHPPIPQF